MAEGLLRHALAVEPEPLKSLRVTSAGISAWGGTPITPFSAAALKKVGIDMSKHQSRALNEQMLSRAVLVVCMTESHRRAIKMDFPEVKVPIVLMREFMPSPADKEVPDPFGADMQTYDDTRDAIMEAVPSVVKYLRGLLAEEGGK
jgi:protein-tyrosine-phosphatase